MNTKKMLLCSVMFIGSMSNASQQKTSDRTPVVLNKGWNTNLDTSRNDLFSYVAGGILMGNCHTFPKTKVFKYQDGSLKQCGRLENYRDKNQKNQHQRRQGNLNQTTRKTFTDAMDKEFWSDIKDQNAVYCPSCETQFNVSNNEIETIGALVLGTRNPQICQRFSQQQKPTQTKEYRHISFNNNKGSDNLDYLRKHMCNSRNKE